MTTWDIIEPCLYNHLGYGNLDDPVWFIGVEEGGVRVWRYETLILEENLHLRAQYDLAVDFRYVWEDLYRIPLESWRGGQRGATSPRSCCLSRARSPIPIPCGGTRFRTSSWWAGWPTLL